MQNTNRFKRTMNEPKNPFDDKVLVVSEAIDYWRKRKDARMEGRMLNLWQRMIEKSCEWENAMAQVRCEILDAWLAYEKRLGLR